MSDAYINGIGVFLPNQPVTNDEIENLLGMLNGKPSRSKKRILNNNGIKTRYYAIDPVTGKQTHNNTQITAEAIRNLTKKVNFSLEELDCLVCGTSGPDQLFPHHGLMVHGELGFPSCEVASTAGVCCAGVASFKYGYMNVLSGLTKNAITTGSELVSNALRSVYFQPEIDTKVAELERNPTLGFEKDFIRWMLSDAAGAILIENTPRLEGLSLRIDWVEYISYANELESCMYMGCKKLEDGSLKGWREVDNPDQVHQESYFAVQQDVKLLGENVISYGGKGLSSVREKRNLDADKISWFLPHYSSEFFREKTHDIIAKAGVPIPYEKWFTNLTTKGNTGSASIYLMLEELLYSGKLQKGETIFCLVPESSRFSYGYIHLTVV
ncbi:MULTISPECIES: beta-ketoacyl-ACP synthase III [Nostocales]|uniref:StlD/DarB family beta-ketosynthase n=1 Tax=Dolichospermum flos-aquae UHCC 0037 TaxID=2590026 RepID=A0ACC7S906_DOLFA|nr:MULTISPECIES: beta-ketoacyl-ACP synthase III [Nostocales]MBO1067339.1 beta-ketoacyl-ACP synthase III [Anabaena sp. 54]MTJ44993.1 StlD/DarB family beta-ketosynthase [Dolichospermum flos-aquae UHCC 0037]